MVVILFSFSLKKTKIEFGYYTLKESYWSHESLDIYSDSTFASKSSGCTYSAEWKGKWSLRNDTLIAVGTQSRNERFDTIFKPCEREEFMYLVRKKSVICIEKDTNNVLYRSTVLFWKDPTKKPEKRQKF